MRFLNHHQMELDVIKKIKVNKMNSFQLLFVCLGSVVVLLSDSSISEGHTRLTTVPFKPFTNQRLRRYSCFSIWSLIQVLFLCRSDFEEETKEENSQDRKTTISS